MKKPLAALAILVSLGAVGAKAMSSKKPESSSAASASSGAASSNGRVWIIRGDGAQSCGMKEGESTEAGAQSLKSEGVMTYGSMKGNDGQMHVQVCGAPKGTLNGYLIDAKDLGRAMALGFKEAPKGFAASK